MGEYESTGAAGMGIAVGTVGRVGMEKVGTAKVGMEKVGTLRVGIVKVGKVGIVLVGKVGTVGVVGEIGLLGGSGIDGRLVFDEEDDVGSRVAVGVGSDVKVGDAVQSVGVGAELVASAVGADDMSTVGAGVDKIVGVGEKVSPAVVGMKEKFNDEG